MENKAVDRSSCGLLDGVRENKYWLFKPKVLRNINVLVTFINNKNGFKVKVYFSGFGRGRFTLILINFKSNWTKNC